MTSRRVQGLLIKQRGLGESDLLVDFFTDRLGRITAVAKGGKKSKKRFFGLLLTAHYLEIHLAPTKWSDLWRLETAELIEPHLGLRLDHRRLMAAGPVLELLLRANAPHDPQPDSLDTALASLGRMAGARRTQEMADILAIFLTRLLSQQGFGLELGQCLKCQRLLQNLVRPHLSHQGGVVCADCGPGPGSVVASPGLLRGLAVAQEIEAAALSRLRFQAGLSLGMLPFLAEFWRRIIGHDLPSMATAQRILAAKSAGC